MSDTARVQRPASSPALKHSKALLAPNSSGSRGWRGYQRALALGFVCTVSVLLLVSIYSQ